MRQLIIIYEFLHGGSTDKRAFEDMIRKYGSYAFMSKNSCIIWTDAQVANVRDNLLNGLNVGDRIFVGVLSAPAAWNNLDKEVSDYIVKNLS